LVLEEELKRATEEKQFELFYQPQVDLRNGQLVGAEALIRWRHPRRGLISPAEFMPVINTSSMAGEVGEWVFATACKQGSIWQNQGHNVRIAVNLSPCQLRSGDLAMVVGEVLRETGLSPRLLELEVTEDIVLADEETALNNFHELRGLGVRLAFDDFGTGYAGLSYLKKFPFHVLKIDRSFVAGLCTSADDMAIVGGTIRMSKQLGLTVIAEGIEDSATADSLRNLDCEEGQGYLYGRPMPASEFERHFLSGNCEGKPGRRAEAA
jgi:EAL domain-containing protein (putative c-di-GMP-specific phosphodiesterase class I)